MIIFARPVSVLLCLLPFRKMTFKSRLYVCWVGLRGAVPIIFATYPLIANIPGAHQIFNIVFFITLLSLLIQGTSVTHIARLLGVSIKNKKMAKRIRNGTTRGSEIRIFRNHSHPGYAHSRRSPESISLSPTIPWSFSSNASIIFLYRTDVLSYFQTINF